MNPKVEIHSLSIAKSKGEQTVFNKYDIEASLEEVGTTETETKVKYTFVLLSNPKSTRISVEGITSITGNSAEISTSLSQDENNIPRIANTIYQELFSLFYVISKSMQIPCPAFKLSHISAPSKSEVASPPAEATETLVTDSAVKKDIVNSPTDNSNTQKDNLVQETGQIQEPVVEEPNVHSV